MGGGQHDFPINEIPMLRMGPETKTGSAEASPRMVCNMNDMSKSPNGQSPSFIREGFITISALQAKEVLESCTYDRQRKIDALHVATLREIMQRGSWLEKSALDFGRMPDGRLWLANGHHRMTSQYESGRSIMWSIGIHDCATVDDLRSLYYRFDTNIRKRTTQNILQGVDFASTHGLTKTMARALYDAAPIIAAGMVAGNRQISGDQLVLRRLADERIEFAERFVREARLYEKCIEQAPKEVKRKLLLAGVTAVAMVTLYHVPDLAEEFWSGIAMNDGLKRGDARSTFLRDLTVRNGKVGTVQQMLVSSAKAWNAYHDGRLLKIIKVNSGQTTTIAGTPYKVEA